MISYIIAHRNRVDLLRLNLRTLLSQTDKDLEAVLVDNSSQEHWDHLKEVTSFYRNSGLNIQLLRIDPSKHPYAHPPLQYGGGYNPALAQNIGARKATGDILVLTSPEVVNAKTNCATIKSVFADGNSRFVLGWVSEVARHHIENHVEELNIDTVKDIGRKFCEPDGAMCRDDYPNRPWLPINYFLGCIKREDFISLGGIDERFMDSMAYEDDFFAKCCVDSGFPAELNTDIAGIHISHPRGYQSSTPKSNKGLWTRISKSGKSIANSGFNFGDPQYITEIF